MSANDGGPAFPSGKSETRGFENSHPLHEGMSLRDWFAGMALVGYNANAVQCANMDHDQAAANAYKDADAMLAARGAK